MASALRAGRTRSCLLLCLIIAGWPLLSPAQEPTGAASSLNTTSGDSNANNSVTSSSPQTNVRQAEQEIERLIAQLQDDAQRTELIENLRLLLEANQPSDDATSTGSLASLSASDVTQKISGYVKHFISEVKTVRLGWLLRTAALSALTLLLAVLTYLLVRKAFTRVAARIADSDGSEAETEQGLSDGLRRALKLVTVVCVVLVLGEIWGTGPLEWAGSLAGQAVGAAALSVVAVFVAALICWHVSDTAIAYLLRRKIAGNAAGRQASRLRSLVPLLRGTARLAIVVIAGLLILSELGLNIGPLLAGAGIFGLAIGFGAQSLVKDFLVGISILIEDSATIGDVIEVGGGLGKVESMELRVIRLRNLDGSQYTIPYSEVATIRNLTKEYSYHLFDIGVAYGEDIDAVLDIVGEVTAELADSAEYGERILDDVEVFGLDKFGDSALLIKGRIKTRPGAQWAIGREFNRRIKNRFDEDNIEIPFPHRTLFFGENKSGHTPAGRIDLVEPDEAAGKSAA